MELSPVAIHSAVIPALQPVPGTPPGATNEQVPGVPSTGDSQEPGRRPDVYEPTIIPGAVGEAEAQYITGPPERSTPGTPQGGYARGRDEQPENEGKPNPLNTDKEPKLRKTGNKGPGSLELTSEEKAKVEELKARDAAVRTHEQAHVMAGGRYIIRRAQFNHVIGPDGKLYAVGGEVQIDTSEVPDDPEATIQKAQAVRRAALAPGDPSAADLQVAAKATQMEFEARMELAQQRTEEALEQAEEYNQEGQSTIPQPEPILLNLFI